MRKNLLKMNNTKHSFTLPNGEVISYEITYGKAPSQPDSRMNPVGLITHAGHYIIASHIRAMTMDSISHEEIQSWISASEKRYKSKYYIDHGRIGRENERQITKKRRSSSYSDDRIVGGVDPFTGDPCYLE